MSVNYDECLNENPFFKLIQEQHSDIIKKATEEDWIICVPRIGTIEPATITPEDILEHILVPNFDLPNTHFCTLSKKRVTIYNKLLKLEDQEPINILFDETFYIEKYQKYKLWCIERPFHRCLINDENCTSVRSLQDCIALLYMKYNDKLCSINKVIDEFLAIDCEFDSLEILKRRVFMLYKDCIEIISSPEICNDNIKLTIETYIQHSIHHKLFPGVCNSTSQIDANFNKVHRNLYGIQLKDLEVKNEFFDNITNARCELSSINRFSTVLGKVECLRRAVNSFSRKDNKHLFFITTDDLIKIFTFLLIKCNLNNWIANLMYVTHFRFSSLNLSDENSFLITTLEAAIEYIKSGELEKIKYNYDDVLLNDNNLNNFFRFIRDGNLDLIKTLFNSKTKNFFVNKISLCHPLCSCEKCESVVPYNINSCDDKGCTALHIACICGQPHIVEYLLSKNADVNVIDHSESTPLHYASLKGQQNAVLLLLHSKALMDVKDCDGNTPLHLSANNGHENCVKALLYFAEQKGCFINVNSKNNNGDTSLHLAAKWGYLGVVNILLQYGANINAINKRNQKVWDVLHNSFLKKLFLTFGDTVNKNEQNILSVNSYLSGKNTNNVGVQLKKLEQIKKIDLALKSIENNDLPLMCYYLGIPTPVNVINSETKGVCHPLCDCDDCIKQFESSTIPSSENIETLNINACNSEGYSPLHIAAKCGRTDILRLLLDSGALVNLKTNKHHFTPLHLACKYQRIQIVRELLKCGGCNLDSQDINGNSPLHYACLSNNTRIIELLLSHGCDSLIKNHEGKTCLQEATSKMLYNVITVLNNKYQNNDISENSSDLFPF